MRDVITLPDGSTLTWDQFSELPTAEKEALLKAKPVAPPQACKNIEPKSFELFPRLKAVAEREGVTEDELLHYMKLMHEIIFGADTANLTHFFGKAPCDHDMDFTKASKIGKPVQTPDGVYRSIMGAARAYKVHRQTMEKWLLKRKPGFFYVNPEDAPA